MKIICPFKNNLFGSYYDNHSVLHVMWNCHMAYSSKYVGSAASSANCDENF